MSTKIENEEASKGSLKVEKKKPGRPRKMVNNPEITKVEIKKQVDAIPEQSTTIVDENKQTETLEKVEERTSESKPEESTKEKEEVIIEEKIVEEAEELTVQANEAIRDEKVEGIQLPENIEKLVNFMNETGGTVEDYVTLNKDYTKFDDRLLIKEYYKKTRPHLNDEELNFVMKDNFEFDEDEDEERFVRKQKLAYKEEVAKAKNFLEQVKSKYYDEIKLRPSVTNEQKKAMEFFQRYNKEQQHISQARNEFVNKTKSFFDTEFEGFNFEVGDQRFKYKVSNPSSMADAQSDITKVINKYTDKTGNITDMSGYHKALYAARNVDKLAEHFYEQGKADATKDIVAKSKNITSSPKAMDTGETLPNGWKVRAISGVDSSKLKFKKKK
tara:strand:- start:1005 stop:2162 length:1158 start_codon:yes stop_codon:yes gene_type:complete